MLLHRFWINPKSGAPGWISLGYDDSEVRAYVAAWYGIAPDSFYVSRAD